MSEHRAWRTQRFWVRRPCNPRMHPTLSALSPVVRALFVGGRRHEEITAGIESKPSLRPAALPTETALPTEPSSEAPLEPAPAAVSAPV